MSVLGMFSRCLIGFVCLIAFSATLVAQASSSLHGTVADPKGAVVPGAKVVLADPQNGLTRTTITDDRGEYQFLQVPPSTYRLTVTAAGFATLKQESLQLLVNTPATQSFTMQVAAESVTIEVSSTAPLVNTQDATLGHAFSTEQIAALPFEGRDPVGILSLQPGVTFAGNVDQSFDSRGGSVNGARSDQTNVTLDGVDNNDQTQGLAFQGALRSTLDSLQEFRVTTANSNADSGRSSGAQVSLVTKSGTNHFHGTAYEYHRPTFTTANDWFNKQAQLNAGQHNVPGKLLRNTFGATFGGPIIKDRLFFFAAYEGQRQRESTQVTRTVPTDNLRNGIIQYKCDVADPNCSSPQAGFDVQNNPLDPTNRIVTLTPAQFAALDPNCTGIGSCPQGPGANPAVLAIFQRYPHPNSTNAGDGLLFSGYTFSAPAPNNLNTYIAKVDYNITQNGNHKLFVRGGLIGDHNSLLPPQFPGQPQAQTGVFTSKGLIAGYTALISNSLINNLRYGYIRQSQDSAGQQKTDFVHFRNLDDITAFTTSNSNNVPVNNFVDDVTWSRGKHTLQFGGNYRLIGNNRTSNGTSFTGATTNVSWLDTSGIANTGGSLDPGAFSGQGYPSVLAGFSSDYDSPIAAVAGLVTNINASYNIRKDGSVLGDGTPVQRKFRSNELEVYAQDTWRVTPTLTVTYGLRYSLLQPPYETTGTQVSPTTSLHDFFQKRGAAAASGQTYSPVLSFDLSGKANGKQPYWNYDYKDLAPRFAFAWAPNNSSGLLGRLFGGAGKSSVRGGYGIYYDHFGEGVVNTFDVNGSFGLTTSISNPAGVQTVDGSARFTALTDIPNTSSAGCSAPPCQLKPPAPLAGFPVTPPTDLNSGGFAITWGLDDKLKTPYSHVINFSWQRELAHGFVFEASYVGRFAHRLLQEEDLAAPLNLVDPKSKVDYYSAATQFAKLANSNTQVADVQPIPYWENLFANAAGPAATQLNGCNPGKGIEANVPTNLTATQALYDLFGCNVGNETSALFATDLFCFPGCADTGKGPSTFQFFDNQYSSLYAWRTVGNSAYNSGQFSLRHAMSHGVSFDLNYTYSKSFDYGSNAERISEFAGFGFNSQIINSWNPKQNRSVSDFDLTHQINFNWVSELPFGHGKRFAGDSGRFVNAVIGGWELAGLFRWSSGFPFTVTPGLGFWPTNWQLTSHAVLTGKRPKTGQFIDPQGDPNLFGSSAAAINNASSQFRFAYPGETGNRNNLRGPGTYGFDAGLSKSWKVTESQVLKFAWQVYNVTNSVRFDAANANSSLSNSASFGKYTNTLTKPRDMEFSLRYSF